MKDWIKATQASIVLGNDPEAAVRGADCVVTDTWFSMGDKDGEHRHNLLKPYQVNAKLMSLAKPDALFMHCLPAHRGDEVTDELIDRAPSAVPVDEAVLPFEVDALDLRGRLTRLGPALDNLLAKHDYPTPVGKLLGEAIVLTTLLGSSLKFDGRFILQTQTDGPVSFLIVDFQAPDRLRAYARFDAKRLKEGLDSGALLGRGHLAMTIDQSADKSRYQGLVALA